ncbi:MAG: radical SAM protein [Synergistaceae bacterium]|jgi:uncharacterized radical SAM superfamily Fe-S cluster-containing enzyme|nr:radical SAM protein [Synergistaceae bacterium]
MSGEIIRETKSLCPVCLRRIPASHVREGDSVFLRKTCPEHGAFSAVIWRGESWMPMKSWRGGIPQPPDDSDARCPDGCGICGNHLQETCCVLVEVTNRCNLNCSFCFAGDSILEDPSTETVKNWLADLSGAGHSFIHFSGGEPTLRDDLPEIAAYAKGLGIRYLQLNTNGVRLANDPAYVKALAGAGVSFAFMQFDGTTDEIHRKLRGAPLLGAKLRAIENCDRFNMGVALVSTVVPGVNDDNVGELISFAAARSPSVRGVHFQPASYFGRYPKVPDDGMRLTLPELLKKIQEQTNGEISPEHFQPSHCDHPMCGFHGNFVVMPDRVLPLTRRGEDAGEEPCCRAPIASPAERSRDFVGRRWERASSCCGNDGAREDLESLDGFLGRLVSHSFTITSMAFQDCYNIDIERLRRCSMHVYANGRTIPLCARYISRQVVC